MGKILELIKSFINPAPEEQSLDELALASGVSQEDLAQLKSSNGIDWAKFSREDEEDKKKGKNSRIIAKEIQEVQQVQKSVKRERDSEMERD